MSKNKPFMKDLFSKTDCGQDPPTDDLEESKGLLMSMQDTLFDILFPDVKDIVDGAIAGYPEDLLQGPKIIRRTIADYRDLAEQLAEQIEYHRHLLVRLRMEADEKEKTDAGT